MEAEDLLLVNVGNPFRCDVRVAGKGMDHLAEEVGEDNDRVVAVCGLRELGDEIDTNGLPRGMRDFQGLGGGSRVLSMFSSGTSFTSFYVLLDKGSHVGPPVVPV
jgi:hypothetical protein